MPYQSQIHPGLVLACHRYAPGSAQHPPSASGWVRSSNSAAAGSGRRASADRLHMKPGRVWWLIRTCRRAQRSGGRAADGVREHLAAAAPLLQEALLLLRLAGERCFGNGAPAQPLALPARWRENWRRGGPPPPEGRRRSGAAAGAAAAAAAPGRGAELGCSSELARIILELIRCQDRLPRRREGVQCRALRSPPSLTRLLQDAKKREN